MFTGIIKSLGTVKRVEKKRGGMNLNVSCKLSVISYQLKEGSSLALNGVCLTAVSCQLSVPLKRDPVSAATVSFNIMPETLKVTTLGSLKVGDRVNLEPALKYGDELGGHLVLGHVDGIGKIVAREKQGQAFVLTIAYPHELEKYIVHKGSIAVDGVSLTVMKHVACSMKRGMCFQVSLVSYTLGHTNLGNKKIGDKVNLEVDVLARYATCYTK